ncbi:hypothetical protein FOA52_012088 [Chlamydomonas sp. UWO 241]|nr:hypothetical protein FOA52_012088 [Chlamydomonas sp. UWO 241]
MVDVPGEGTFMVVHQVDATERTELEEAMMNVTENQAKLLFQIYPRHVLEALAAQGDSIDMTSTAKSHDDVTIMFLDIVGFTSMSDQVAPSKVMALLTSLFSMMDHLADHHGVHKVEIAGDCYIVSGGILEAGADADGFYNVLDTHSPVDSAKRVFNFARDALAGAAKIMMPHNDEPVTLRVGMHTGPCVSGLVGTKQPKFAIFGDTMNTAARMESTGRPGRIQVSEATYALLCGITSTEEWEPTGGVECKGKGCMQTHLWTPTQALELSCSLPADLLLTGVPRVSLLGTLTNLSTTLVKLGMSGRFKASARFNDYPLDFACTTERLDPD